MMLARWMIGVVVAAPTVGAAQAEPQRLTTEEMRALLPTIIATGAGTKQTFSPGGYTTYWQGGRESLGTWWAENDEYCSRWPPADGFACYTVAVDDAPEDGGAAMLIWTGDSGAPIVNRIQPRE